ncbi:hypothetical protein C4X99_04660 [Leptospira interrogans serovar Geyaweera]|nr:hypothetical protein C4X99_04660 [Leptospira interrogans serovar Geyaweera]
MNKIRTNLNAIWISFFSLILGLHCYHPQKNNYNEQIIGLFLQQRVALYGDSISAFWPDELLKPMVVSKIAFPNRNSAQILQAALDTNTYFDFCIYNGGANDYLGDFSIISQDRLDQTVNNQKETFKKLLKQCGYTLALGVYYVEPPWPVFAAPQLNQRMKERISKVPIFDLSLVVKQNMLMDGGHLTYDGYKVISESIVKLLNPIQYGTVNSR